jgi:RNA polymerase sigma factor (sigma-70 family)
MQERRRTIAEVMEHERARFVAFVQRKALDLSHMDAEDVVADVLYNVWNRVDLSAPVEHLLAYLYTAFTNRIIDFRRRRRPTVSLEAHDDEGEPLGDRLSDADADTEALLARQDLREGLYQAIAQLPPKQRAVWIATEVAGHTFAELSAQWGEPLGTLLARKHRATKALQKHLREMQA